MANAKPAFPVLFAILASILFLTGCSDQERREIRMQQERIAKHEAEQRRLAEQHAEQLRAETQRRKDALDAETERQFKKKLASGLTIVGIASVIGAVIGFVAHSIRRLGESHIRARNQRHALSLKALETDSHLSPEDRRDLYRTAIEAANDGGTLLLGYAGNPGGAS